MYEVAVNTDKCDGCEECVNIRPSEVFQIVEQKSDPHQAAIERQGKLTGGCQTTQSSVKRSASHGEASRKFSLADFSKTQ